MVTGWTASVKTGHSFDMKVISIVSGIHCACSGIDDGEASREAMLVEAWALLCAVSGSSSCAVVSDEPSGSKSSPSLNCCVG